MHTGEMTTLYYWARPRDPVIELRTGPILTYCPNCHFIPRTPHLYAGSRYGDMGSFTCQQCGGKVSVRDQDCRPPIEYSYSRPDTPPGRSSGPFQTIVYEELYRIQWTDFQQVEAWTGQTFLEKTGSGTFAFEPIFEMLAGHVRQQGLNVQEAPIELPFITWIPEPFRQWLDLTHTLKQHQLGRE